MNAGRTVIAFGSVGGVATAADGANALPHLQQN